MICGLSLPFLQQIVEPLNSRIRNEAHKLFKQCEEGFEHTKGERDCSVYTGTGGIKVTLFSLFSIINLLAFYYMHVSQMVFSDWLHYSLSI